MEHIDNKKKLALIRSAVIPSCAHMSTLRAGVCKINADKCPLGGNLKCLQSGLLQNQNIPHYCTEHLIKLGLECAKTVWQVAEIYAQDIFLPDTLSPELRRFLDSEKERQSQI